MCVVTWVRLKCVLGSGRKLLQLHKEHKSDNLCLCVRQITTYFGNFLLSDLDCLFQTVVKWMGMGGQCGYVCGYINVVNKISYMLWCFHFDFGVSLLSGQIQYWHTIHADAGFYVRAFFHVSCVVCGHKAWSVCLWLCVIASETDWWRCCFLCSFMQNLRLWGRSLIDSCCRQLKSL